MAFAKRGNADGLTTVLLDEPCQLGAHSRLQKRYPRCRPHLGAGLLGLSDDVTWAAISKTGAVGRTRARIALDPPRFERRNRGDIDEQSPVAPKANEYEPRGRQNGLPHENER